LWVIFDVFLLGLLAVDPTGRSMNLFGDTSSHEWKTTNQNCQNEKFIKKEEGKQQQQLKIETKKCESMTIMTDQIAECIGKIERHTGNIDGPSK